jgi:HJR/Mrr/RecB family endonuclease
MSKLYEKVVALKSSIESKQNELDSMPKFENLWDAESLINDGAFKYVLYIIGFSISVVIPMSWVLFGWIFYFFTPLPAWYGGVILPSYIFFKAGQTYYTIKKAHPDIFYRIKRLKKSIAEETAELKKTVATLAKVTAKASELERKNIQVMPEYWSNLKGVKLEVAISKLMTDLGYLTNLTKGSGDGGIDVVARKDEKTLFIQCKGWAKPVGSPVVRDMAGVASAHNGIGIVVSPNGFSKEAILFGKKSGVELWDSNKLSKMSPNMAN